MNYLILLNILINLHLKQFYKYHQIMPPKGNGQNFIKNGLQIWKYKLNPKQITDFVRTKEFKLNKLQLKTPLGEEKKKVSKISRIRSLSDKGKNYVNQLMYRENHTFVHNGVSFFVILGGQFCSDGGRREKFRQILEKYLENDAYAVVEGFLLGGAKILSKGLNQQFKNAGVSHLLSASGSNVSLVLLIDSPFLWKKFGKLFTAFMGVFLLTWYVQIAGCSAPLVRAAVSGILSLFGTLLLQKVSPLWILGVTTLVLVLCRSEYLIDVGFQLSVAATCGICLFSKLSTNKNREGTDTSSKYLQKTNYQSNREIAKYSSRTLLSETMAKKLATVCKQSLTTTLGAQLFTLPIILWRFGELSTVMLVSNVVLLWMVPFVVGWAVLTVVAGLLQLHIAAVLCGSLTTFCTHIFLALLNFFGANESVLLKLTKTQVFCTLFVYLLVILILFVGKNKYIKLHQKYKLLCLV